MMPGQNSEIPTALATLEVESRPILRALDGLRAETELAFATLRKTADAMKTMYEGMVADVPADPVPSAASDTPEMRYTLPAQPILDNIRDLLGESESLSRSAAELDVALDQFLARLGTAAASPPAGFGEIATKPAMEKDCTTSIRDWQQTLIACRAALGRLAEEFTETLVRVTEIRVSSVASDEHLTEREDAPIAAGPLDPVRNLLDQLGEKFESLAPLLVPEPLIERIEQVLEALDRARSLCRMPEWPEQTLRWAGELEAVSRIQLACKHQSVNIQHIRVSLQRQLDRALLELEGMKAICYEINEVSYASRAALQDPALGRIENEELVLQAELEDLAKLWDLAGALTIPASETCGAVARFATASREASAALEQEFLRDDRTADGQTGAEVLAARTSQVAGQATGLSNRLEHLLPMMKRQLDEAHQSLRAANQAGRRRIESGRSTEVRLSSALEMLAMRSASLADSIEGAQLRLAVGEGLHQGLTGAEIEIVQLLDRLSAVEPAVTELRAKLDALPGVAA